MFTVIPSLPVSHAPPPNPSTDQPQPSSPSTAAPRTSSGSTTNEPQPPSQPFRTPSQFAIAMTRVFSCPYFLCNVLCSLQQYQYCLPVSSRSHTIHLSLRGRGNSPSSRGSRGTPSKPNPNSDSLQHNPLTPGTTRSPAGPVSVSQPLS